MHRTERNNFSFPFIAPLTCSQKEVLSYEASVQPLLRRISCLISYLFTSALFPEPWPEISTPEKAEKSKALLKEIGGKSFVIECEDGTTLEGMKFTAHEFSLRLQKALKTEDIQAFVLGTDYSSNSYVCFEEKKELDPFIETGAIVSVSGFLFVKDEQECENSVVVTRSAIPLLGELEKPTVEPTLCPTMILSPGLSAPYTLYTALIGRMLLSGLDVVVYNPSGRGESTGRPSEERWIEDAEKVYHFVQSENPSKRILVWASCFGIIAGARLAKRYKTDLIVDRGFDRFAVIASHYLGCKVPKWMRAPITYLLEKAISCATRHRASDLFNEIEGNILLINDYLDEVVPLSQRMHLEKSLGPSTRFIRRKMVTYLGHRQNWLIKGEPWKNLTVFFKEIGLVTPTLLQHEFIEKLSDSHFLRQLLMDTERKKLVENA